jgi:hypothetical protein
MGWVLEVDWLGRTFTFNEVQAEVVESFDLFVDSPRVRSITITDIYFPSDINLSDLIINRGYRLDTATARLILDGVTHLQGRVVSPVFSGADKPCQFTVTENEWEDTALFPSSFEVTLRVKVEEDESDVVGIERHNDAARALRPFLDIELWPSLADKDYGRTHQIVFGEPGAIGIRSPGSPAFFIDTVNSYLQIAGHEVESTTTTIWGPDASGDLALEASVPITHVQDGDGRWIAQADISGAATVDKTRVEDDWWVEWADGRAMPGGYGDVLELMLEASTLRFDRNWLRGAKEDLNARFALDGYIDEPVTPYEWIQDNLLSMLPMAPVVGKDGLYFVLWDPPSLTTVIDTMIEGPEVILDSDLQVADLEAVNEVRFEYRYRPDKNTTTAVAKVDSGTSAYSALSSQGKTSGRVISSNIVDKEGTAYACAHLWANLYAFPPIVLALKCDRTRYDNLRAGDIVAFTSQTLTLAAKLGMITAIARDGSPMLSVEISLFTDPIIRAI